MIRRLELTVYIVQPMFISCAVVLYTLSDHLLLTLIRIYYYCMLSPTSIGNQSELHFLSSSLPRVILVEAAGTGTFQITLYYN